MKRRNQFCTVVTALALSTAVLLTGCSSKTATAGGSGTSLRDDGVITLSVNPEIRIEYNKEGQVTALSGNNTDGKGIVAAYQDYIGKNCETVLEELIVEIHEAGYFIDDVDGNKKNIVIQLEPGSVLPHDDFLENMGRNTQEAVQSLALTSGIVTIDDDDYDPGYAENGRPSPYITLTKAQEIALAQANVRSADAVFEDKEFDFENHAAVFELEFTANGNEYDYDVDAVTGKILKAKHHVAGTENDTDYGSANDGITDYSMTDYGPNNDGVTDYGNTNYGPNNDGVTDYNDTDYGPNNDGVTDYNDTDYGPDNDGVTDYNDTDYGPDSDGVTDYNNTDYGPNNDGVTDYGNSDYGPNNDGVTDYNDTSHSSNDGDSNYDNGDTNYDDDNDD